MIRTAEQIKDALERCANNKPCKGCAYCTSEEKFMCTDVLMNDTLKHIANLEAKVPKWVSVKDELPACVPDEYLVANSDNRVFVAEWGHERWSSEYRFSVGSEILHDVTHWLPLPEPPEEEDHDELS